jgi:16S rRNA (cytosine1402-N4)-methyltransferase
VVEEGHLPVLVEEVVRMLAPRPGSLLIDATLGGGGHTERILEAASPDGRVLGLDADPAAIARAGTRLARFGDRVVLRRTNFRDLAAVAPPAGFATVDGVLLDLGLSSHQLADRDRGFGFRTGGPLDMRFDPTSGGPLDMRFDPTSGEPAAALVARLSEDELTTLLRDFGEEPHARRVARAIVNARRTAPIDTAERLAEVVAAAIPRRPGPPLRIHPATRTFQALRIAVNDELGALATVLPAAVQLLRPGGRLVVLAYHSLEDRIVKRFVAAERRGCVCPPSFPVCRCGRLPTLLPVGRQPTVPTEAEVAANPRARSAHLRAAERLAA